MGDAFICDAARTPIGRYGGVLSSVRTDDLGAIPMAALIERNSSCIGVGQGIAMIIQKT
jgi:acetyl-CoA acetyltransferase